MIESGDGGMPLPSSSSGKNFAVEGKGVTSVDSEDIKSALKDDCRRVVNGREFIYTILLPPMNFLRKARKLKPPTMVGICPSSKVTSPPRCWRSPAHWTNQIHQQYPEGAQSGPPHHSCVIHEPQQIADCKVREEVLQRSSLLLFQTVFHPHPST